MDEHSLTEPSGPRDLFLQLVEHFEGMPAHRLEALCETYEVDEQAADALARQWCQAPERVLEVLGDALGHRAWNALLDLAYEHDAAVDVSWLEPEIRSELAKVGMLQKGPIRHAWNDPDSVPGLIAAIVAPRFEQIRPSLPVLLGRLDRPELSDMAAEYGRSEDGSRVELLLRIHDVLGGPEAVEEILGRLPSPDWLGAALMTLELGGVCYWQEVFGYEVDERDQDTTVVPLMRNEERAQEEQIGDLLRRLGVIFRFREGESPWTNVAVPEELWGPLWTVGREWLLQWVDGAYRDLRGQNIGREAPAGAPPLQSVAKWLVCECQGEGVTVEEGDLSEESARRLESVASTDLPDWPTYLELSFELKVLRRDHQGWVLPGPECKKLLDMPAREFRRNVLYEWCSGFAGRSVDENLPEAIGLDESWRSQAVEILRARHEFIPTWMHAEGIPPEQTGSGCLRDEHDNPPEQLAAELSLVNGYVWGTKLLWLDLLSMLESGRWYPQGLLRELIQLSASVCLFSQVGYLLEDPRAWYYLPVQRSSFLTGPLHTDHFETWMGEVVERLLVPLGVAHHDPDDGLTRLETEALRIQSPPGWPEEHRLNLLRAIIGEEAADFETTPGGRRDLRQVVEAVAEDTDLVSLQTPVDDLTDACRDREIAEFDGRHLRLREG